MTVMPALVRLVEEVPEVLEGADLGEDVDVVGDVVAAVAQRGREERRDPEAVDAQPLQVVELLASAVEVAGAVGVGVLEGPDQHFVEDGGLEPHRASGWCISSVISGVNGPPHRQDVRGLVGRVEPHVVVLAPAPVLAGDLVVDDEGLVPVEAERRHVEVDDRLAGAVRVDVDDHDHGVVGAVVEACATC